MTAINPNTTVYLLNCPLTKDSENTFYFASENAQYTYFYTQRMLELTKYTYQRERREYLKIGVNGSDMANVINKANYMMFVNTAYNTKRYYAFITEAEWINNEVVKLYFELDYIQTYLFDYTESECFIARQHSSTDTIGDNIMPEEVELGEYIYDGNTKCRPYQQESYDLSCIVAYELDNNQTGTCIDGVFSACKITVYSNDSTGRQALQAMINSHSQAPEEVLAIIMSNYMYLGIAPQTGAQVVTASTQAVEHYVNVPNVSTGDDFEGYIPKNKKLLTYPYNFVNITNCKGAEMNLRYEFWKPWSSNTNYVRLKMFSTKGLPATVQIRPYQYKGEDYSSSTSGSEGISSNNFIEYGQMPVATWSNDSFEVWVAQNHANIAGDILNAATGLAAGIGVGLATENPLSAVGGITSSVRTATNIAVSGYNASIASDRLSGTVAGTAVYYNTDFDGIFYRRCHITKQYAKMIDNFLTMYGYAQRIVAQPNRHTRTRFTYIRTVGMEAIGNIPQDAKQYIAARYDSGIRFWADHSNFGTYSADNAII